MLWSRGSRGAIDGLSARLFSRAQPDATASHHAVYISSEARRLGGENYGMLEPADLGETLRWPKRLLTECAICFEKIVRDRVGDVQNRNAKGFN
jgi:hypothetical protein